MGKNILIFVLRFVLNFVIKFMKMEYESWKIIMRVDALFLSNDKYRYCLIVFKNLFYYKRNKINELELISL